MLFLHVLLCAFIITDENDTKYAIYKRREIIEKRNIFDVNIFAVYKYLLIYYCIIVIKCSLVNLGQLLFSQNKQYYYI